MPRRPPNQCKVQGCPEPALDGQARCQYHHQEYLKRKRRVRHKKPKVPYGPNWREISKVMLEAYPYCKICGKPAEVVHHIKERADGGSDDPSNLVTLCNSCHSSYHWYKRFRQNKSKRREMLRLMKK